MYHYIHMIYFQYNQQQKDGATVTFRPNLVTSDGTTFDIVK